MLAATGASDRSPDEYGNGAYVAVGVDLGGRALGGAIVAAAALAMVGQFVSEMSSDAYQLSGMAERGLLPAALARKSPSTGTPTYAILLSAVGVLALHSLTFDAIVATENLLYAVSMAIELVAFVALRRRAATLDRRYVAPVSDDRVALMILPATLLLVVVVAIQPVLVWVLSLGLLLLGFALYALLGYARRSGNIAFNALHGDWAGQPGSLAFRLGWTPDPDDPGYDPAPGGGDSDE